MARVPVRVGCFCGWRGKRVNRWFEFDCGHDLCTCSGFGVCPKCGGRLDSMRFRREADQRSKETETWFADMKKRAQSGDPEALKLFSFLEGKTSPSESTTGVEASWHGD